MIPGLLPPSVVARVDLRGLRAEEGLEQLSTLFSTPGINLAGLLVIDDALELLTHEEVFERIAASPLVAGMVVVAVGPAGKDRSLAVPPCLRGERAALLLWVSDPVGVAWGPGVPSIARLAAPATGQPLERLLAVLSVPEIFTPLSQLADPPAATPGLAIFGQKENDDDLVRALVSALEQVAGRPASGPLPLAGSDAVQALRAQLETPPDSSVVVEGGPVHQLVEEIRHTTEDVISAEADLHRVWRPWGGFPAVLRCADHLLRLGQALAGLRTATLQVRSGLQTPGGGYDLTLVNERCRSFGLRLGSPDPSHGTDLGRLLGAVAAEWLRGGANLADVDERLHTLQREVGARTFGQYSAAVEEICPESLIDLLMSPPAFAWPPRWLFFLAAPTGLLAGLWPEFGLVTGRALILAWCVMLANWPLSPTAERVKAVALGGFLSLLGVAAGVWLGTTVSPNAVVSGFAVSAAMIITVVSVGLAWQHRVREWFPSAAIQAVPQASSGLTDLLSTTVRSEWTALNLRQGVVDLLSVARSVTDGARQALLTVIDDLRRRLLSAANRDGASQYWVTIADAQARSLLVGLLQQTWDHLAGRRPEDVKPSTESLVRESFGRWVEADRAVMLGTAQASADMTPYGRFGTESVDEIVQTVTTNAMSAMWQLTSPEDVILLSQRPGDCRLIRFAPAALPTTARDRLPRETIFTNAIGLAGVLRLTSVREGIVTQVWRTSTNGENDTSPANSRRKP